MTCKKKNLKLIPTSGLVSLNQLSEWLRRTRYLLWTSLLQPFFSSLRNYLELLKRYFKMRQRRNYKKKEVTPTQTNNMTVIDEDNKHKREIILNGNDFINVKTSKVVEIENHLFVSHTKGPVKLRVKISADFNEVDEEYHEIFLNVMTSKYLGSVSFGDNPFSECAPMKRRKWYEIWKTKYYI